MTLSRAERSRLAKERELSRLRFQNERLAQDIFVLRDENRPIKELKEELEQSRRENGELRKELEQLRVDNENNRGLWKIRKGLDDSDPDHLSRDLIFNNILAAIKSPTFEKTLRTENQELRLERQALTQQVQSKERELELEKKNATEMREECKKLRMELEYAASAANAYSGYMREVFELRRILHQNHQYFVQVLEHSEIAQFQLT